MNSILKPQNAIDRSARAFLLSFVGILVVSVVLAMTSSDEIKQIYPAIGGLNKLIFTCFTYQFAKALGLKTWQIVLYCIMSTSVWFFSVIGLLYTYRRIKKMN
jgi:hypothetical protein